MGYILICMSVVALVGGMVAAGIKLLQWFIATITLEIFFDAPTWQSTWKLVMIFAAVGAVIGLIGAIIECACAKEREYVWISNDEISICYRIKPPHFRNVSEHDMFGTCGFCKHYNSDTGCEKYGVICHGVGSVVKTCCDDYKCSM